MRIQLDIDEGLMSTAMKAGPFSTKRQAVEAGLRLLVRRVAHRNVLAWRGRLRWQGDDSIDWTKPAVEASDV